MKQIKKRIASFLMAVAMVLSMVPTTAFAAETDANAETDVLAVAPTYEFGSAKTVLKPGKYNLPVVMNKADKPGQSSMAGSCVKGATLTVAEDGSAKVTINLGPVSVSTITGWGSDWQIYTENGYTNPDSLVPCEYTTIQQGKETFVDSITFDMPDNSWDGVYTHMYIAVMGLEQDAYFKMDFAGATPYAEPVPVTFSAGAHGTLIATVNNKEIKSGDLVKAGAKVIFTAKADAGYVVDSWTGVDATGNSVVVTADKALNVSVTFTEKVVKNYVVNFSAGANGTLTAAVDGKEIRSGAEVVEGSTVIFTAVPADGYVVDSWKGATGDGNSANAIVNGELNVTVTFKLIIDRTELDKAIADAEAKVAAPMDYPDDANWAAMLTALETAKNPDLIMNTAQANYFAKQLNDASAKVVKLDKTAFAAAYDKFGVSWRGKSYAGYPKTVTMPCDEVVKLAQSYDTKRAKSQAEIDAVTEQMVAVYNELQAYIDKDIKLANIKHKDGTETAYINFVEAIKAYNAGNDIAVILLSDLELVDTINGRRASLDLNGHTLSVDDLVQLAQLTSSKENAVLNANLKFSAEVTLNKNLTINGQIRSKAKITIDGATINAPEGNDAFGFENYYCIPEIVVNSGTITAKDGYAIPAYISRGQATQITINNGTLVGKDYAVKGISPVTVNGGQFKAAKGAVTGADVVVPEGMKLSRVADDNGFFKLISAEAPETISGVISVDGKEYTSVEEAFKNLASGAQVKLLADADVMRYTEIAQNCTLDLNGYKLTVHPFNQNADHQKDTGDYWCVVKILEGVKVDVIDSSAEKTGTLSQISTGSFNAGILVFGEMTATDILVDNQNTDDGALILTFNTTKSRVVADNIHLADTNKGAIFNGGSEVGTTVLKNITETFDSQKDTLLQSDDITSPAYIIENCHFTDAGSSRRLSDNVTIRNTTWEFTQGGKLNIEAYEVRYDAVLEDSVITTTNSSEAVFIKYYKSAILKNTTIKNTDGYAVNFQNELINPYTIESGTYEGKDYAVITDTVINVNGGQFKGAHNAVSGQVILPKGKTLALTDGYYKLVDGHNNPFEDAAGKDATVYDSDGSLLGGVDLVAGAPMLFLPNNGKVVLQKDVAVAGAVHLSMLNGGRYTFDLNGHKADLNKANNAVFFFDKGTSVTFEDSVGTAVVDLSGVEQLQFGSTEGTGLIINGGTWNNGEMFGSMSQAHVVFAGGHFNVNADMLCNESPNFVVTGGDFNYDVSEAKTAPMYDPNEGWILGVVCDPVNHDTHDAMKKDDGRWYVVPMSEMPAPEAPVITPESKTFNKGETVEVSMTAAEGDIYYTLDGTKPTSKSTKYEAPFTVDKTTTVTAVVIVGSRISAFAEATYTMVTPDSEFAAAVDAKIAAIGEVTLESEAAITEARAAYEALTDAQKALVKNLAVLEAAESTLAKLKNTAVLAEGSYIVPIVALTSKAPLEPVAIAFSKAFGDTVRIDVAADGKMTATIVPQHMNIELFGTVYQCNVLKLRSSVGEAQYFDITTQKYTDANDSQLHDIQAPGKMVVGMPAYDETKNGYPLELTVDFMNTMYGDVAADNWMDIVLSLDMVNAEPVPEANKTVRVTYYTTGAGTVARKTVEVAESKTTLTAEDCAETLPEGYRFIKSGVIRDSRRGNTVRVMIEKIPAKETRTVIVNYVSETGRLIGIKKVVVDSASIALTAEDCAATMPAGYQFVKSGYINSYMFCNTAVVTVSK